MNTDPRYNVEWRVNGVITSTAHNLSAEQAYDNAIPGEALMPVEGSRWNVLMRKPALDKMAELKPGESLKVCYQDAHPLPGYDKEEITIFRNDENLLK